MEWTNEIIAQLTQLWMEGHSTAEIGRRLGFSKNAIVGKARRVGLPGRPSPVKGGKANPDYVRTNKEYIARVARVRAAPMLPIANMEGPKPVHVLPVYSAQVIAFTPSIMKCQFPFGTPGKKGFRFCDDRSEPGKPYCDKHCGRCYVGWQKRKEDAA